MAETNQNSWKRPAAISASVMVAAGLAYLMPGVLASLGAAFGLVFIFWVVRGSNGHRLSGSLALVFAMVIALGLSAAVTANLFHNTQRPTLPEGLQILTVNAAGEAAPATQKQLQVLATMPPRSQPLISIDAVIVLLMVIAAGTVSALLVDRLQLFQRSTRRKPG